VYCALIPAIDLCMGKYDKPETDPEKIRLTGRNRLLFPEEVCVLLGIDRQQLYKLTRLQRLPSVRLSLKVIRYSLDDIDNTLQKLTLKAF
jgi:predicted DNA-binding transcriptional regulator AlpA